MRGASSRADGSHSLDVPLLPSSSLHSSSLLTELEVTFCPRKFSSEDRLLLEVAGGPGRHLSLGSHDHHWGYRLLGEGGGGGGREGSVAGEEQLVCSGPSFINGLQGPRQTSRHYSAAVLLELVLRLDDTL